ncbi:MAG: ornithine decarboxylase, partial [Firmicutes bacterium]|nr:ornithine decarboxylase [Bacillota bacterium]
MRSLKIAFTESVKDLFSTTRPMIDASVTDYTDIAAAVVSDTDMDIIRAIDETKFGVPIFVFSETCEEPCDELNEIVYRWVYVKDLNRSIVDNEIEAAAEQYEWRVLPPFFETLSNYMELKNQQFNCPGHQGGQYFRKHPAGRYLYDFYGEMIFRSDICNADVALGDLLIHEGPAEEALKNAAKVFHSDNTFFVMNGTSTSNIIVGTALVAPGDLVLFDRNNHKSIYDATMIQAGGTPIYLETSRNPFGFIGGIDDHCFDEAYLRERIAKVDPEKAKAERPFRLAVIQLGTYDGTIYNARQVVDRIGHLCDYILFDSAWVGYEQFIPMMKNCSPLLLELGPDDPGIFVTQSVHKQQAGFSQSSYIHKKDSHIKGQKRYLDYKRFNNSYRAHSSTSPFYPIFAALDVNARMQDRAAGRKMWADCVKMGIETRKAIFRNCSLLRPFVPPTVNGKPWQEHDTEEIAQNIDFFKFIPGEKWHSFEGYGEEQYFVDPNKLMLTTPGIDVETGEYEDFGIPATILANYLRDNRIIPEKNDFNSILFLMTPAETKPKLDSLVAQLKRFEKLVAENASVSRVIPYLYGANQDRYRGVGIRDLCQEMHDFYKERNAKEYQRRLFREATLPEVALSPYEAGKELIRNHAKLVPLDQLEGEVALEGALPYPPGIFCVAPGERWSKDAVEYFKILEEGINRFPGFAPEIHGVYLEKENGKTKTYAYVWDP